MRRRYTVMILTGMLLTAVFLGGCSNGSRTAQQGSSSSEEELQAEIDALRQELDELKSSQESESTQTQASDSTQTQSETDPAEQTQNNQTQNSGTKPQSGSSGSSADTGNPYGVSISLEQAQQIALNRVPGASAQNISIELDADDGWYVYEGDILYNRMEYEFEIDANSGTILKWEQERW